MFWKETKKKNIVNNKNSCAKPTKKLDPLRGVLPMKFTDFLYKHILICKAISNLMDSTYQFVPTSLILINSFSPTTLLIEYGVLIASCLFSKTKPNNHCDISF